MIIRLFQGYFESCIFAGTQYILGSWYTKRELGKRTGLFTASGLAGGMFGGFLQTGIYDSMNGLHGLPGWRWLFIVSVLLGSSFFPGAEDTDLSLHGQISGTISMPVAVYGYFFFPDTPHSTSAFYFTEEEKQLARNRVPIVERSEAVMSVSFLRKVLTSWYFYGFGFLWILGNCSESQSTQALLNLYMKALPERDYTVPQLNKQMMRLTSL